MQAKTTEVSGDVSIVVQRLTQAWHYRPACLSNDCRYAVHKDGVVFARPAIPGPAPSILRKTALQAELRTPFGDDRTITPGRPTYTLLFSGTMRFRHTKQYAPRRTWLHTSFAEPWSQHSPPMRLSKGAGMLPEKKRFQYENFLQ